MKTWIKRTLIGVASAAVLFGGVAAWAHRHHGGPWTAERAVERVADRMDLDAAQKAKLSVLAERLVEQRDALRAGAGGEPRAAALALLAGPSFDRAGAEALLAAKADTLRAGAPQVIAAFGDFYDSLAPAQQQRLREFMQRGHGHDRDDD